MDVFDAAERYKQEGSQLIVMAGKDYGSGSSRDWAAKGPWMLVRPSSSVCYYLVLDGILVILFIYTRIMLRYATICDTGYCLSFLNVFICLEVGRKL